ncbi:DUF924 family protein [Amaricoccus sp.]|uniref:DUF924 family protein n=1 Tax=Amaricoccus sp. TaxID=1872485 RepID=UPI0026118F82|nr:DUF924 family protein [Amaricoccus sp.]HRO10549.1 DUF924 family protein [Amaricoccus sp.]
MYEGAREVLDYWLGIGPDGWYRGGEELDAEIRSRFGALWEEGRAGKLAQWRASPASCLALLVLLDQFPRNMFRGDARSFATDARALRVAKSAIQRRQDRRVGLPERQFFYTPLMHSEVLADQDQSVRMYLLNFGREGLLPHAQAHREIIRRFGRFPYRNAALGRESTPEEVAFLAEGGYTTMLNRFAPKASQNASGSAAGA